jgi:hypothetical protein
VLLFAKKSRLGVSTGGTFVKKRRRTGVGSGSSYKRKERTKAREELVYTINTVLSELSWFSMHSHISYIQ